jgi:K+-sensing histidine kinase KdpD
VAERFSKIGSKPEAEAVDLIEVVEHAVGYVQRRSPAQVEYEFVMPQAPLLVRVNAPLMEWVLENLCKNAVDAMENCQKKHLTVTEKGANALRDFRKVCDETDEQVFSGFTEEEKETLMYFLKRLNMNIADNEMTKDDFKKILNGGDR